MWLPAAGTWDRGTSAWRGQAVCRGAQYAQHRCAVPVCPQCCEARVGLHVRAWLAALGYGRLPQQGTGKPKSLMPMSLQSAPGSDAYDCACTWCWPQAPPLLTYLWPSSGPTCPSLVCLACVVQETRQACLAPASPPPAVCVQGGQAVGGWGRSCLRKARCTLDLHQTRPDQRGERLT